MCIKYKSWKHNIYHPPPPTKTQTCGLMGQKLQVVGGPPQKTWSYMPDYAVYYYYKDTNHVLTCNVKTLEKRIWRP